MVLLHPSPYIVVMVQSVRTSISFDSIFVLFFAATMVSIVVLKRFFCQKYACLNLSAHCHGDLKHLLRTNAANLAVWMPEDNHEQMVPWSLLQTLQMNVDYTHQRSSLRLHFPSSL
jgi:hypothetical protein